MQGRTIIHFLMGVRFLIASVSGANLGVYSVEAAAGFSLGPSIPNVKLTLSKDDV